MPNIDVPDGPEPIHLRALSLRPEFRQPWIDLYQAVVNRSILPWRISEATRYRIAQINGCIICQAHRAPGGEGQEFTEQAYAEVASFATSELFSEREKLAIEFSELFALDHHKIDAEFFDRLHANFTDEEILDLTFCTARYMAFGRLTHVLGLDDSCELTPSVVADWSSSILESGAFAGTPTR
jgi:alkylhydroperoxidase family enzyme